jgi:hypothetical protein
LSKLLQRLNHIFNTSHYDIEYYLHQVIKLFTAVSYELS